MFQLEPTLLFWVYLPFLLLQLAFWLILVLPVLNKIKPETEKPKEIPDAFSILVAAHNELEHIKMLLPLLYAQKGKNFEIILVDDRSNDGSQDFLIAEAIRQPRLRHVRINACPDHLDTKKFALTLGIRKAKHKRILFIDADTKPKDEWWAARMLQSPKTIQVGWALLHSESGFLSKVFSAESLLSNLQLFAFARMGGYGATGRNLSYTSDFFLDNNGFKGFYDQKGGDDDVFINSYATKDTIDYINCIEAMTLSKPKENWSEWHIQKQRHVNASKRYKWTMKLYYALYALSYFLCWTLGIAMIASSPTNILHLVPPFLFLIACISVFLHAHWKLSPKVFVMPTLSFLGVSNIFYILSYLPALGKNRIKRWK